MYRDIAFIWTKICAACSGSWLLQSPYKHNCKNNSKLSTNRDLGEPRYPNIPGSYKQALSIFTVAICQEVAGLSDLSCHKAL